MPKLAAALALLLAAAAAAAPEILWQREFRQLTGTTAERREIFPVPAGRPLVSSHPALVYICEERSHGEEPVAVLLNDFPDDLRFVAQRAPRSPFTPAGVVPARRENGS